MSPSRALLITAIAWPAGLVLLVFFAGDIDSSMHGVTIAWCIAIGMAVGFAICWRTWHGMHLAAGLAVRDTPANRRPLTSWQIAASISAGGALGTVVVPLTGWLMQRVTGVSYAAQLLVVGVVSSSCGCFLLAISAILRARAAIARRNRKNA